MAKEYEPELLWYNEHESGCRLEPQLSLQVGYVYATFLAFTILFLLDNYFCSHNSSFFYTPEYIKKWKLWTSGGDGASSRECSDTFRGESAASEPETQAVLDYLTAIFPPNQRGANPADSDGSPDDAMGVALDIHAYR